MTCSRPEAIARGLRDDGFVVVPSVLTAAQVEEMRGACARVLSGASRDHLNANRTTGSMLGVERDPSFAGLIAHPVTLSILRGLGWGQIAWSAGYVISKPANGPRLFWHQDWLWWNHPLAADPLPHQLFAMFYAVDTTRENGCLRVVPGSHVREMPAHRQLGAAHSAQALSGADADAPMMGDIEGEIDVPVRAGDLILGDSRLLHAAHANLSSEPRSLVTLWYHPAFDLLPQGIQAHLATHCGGLLADWPAAARNRIDCALPYAASDAVPLDICRVPAFAL